MGIIGHGGYLTLPDGKRVPLGEFIITLGPEGEQERAECGFTIRGMSPIDMDRVVDIDHEAFRCKWYRRDFRAALQDHAARCRVAVLDGRIVGYAIWQRLPHHEILLCRLAVDEGYRRLQVGSTLVLDQLRFLSERRDTAWCIVRAKDLSVQQWLRAMGWVATSTGEIDAEERIGFVFRYGWPMGTERG